MTNFDKQFNNNQHKYQIYMKMNENYIGFEIF